VQFVVRDLIYSPVNTITDMTKAIRIIYSLTKTKFAYARTYITYLHT